jgi:hypothetical protein
MQKANKLQFKHKKLIKLSKIEFLWSFIESRQSIFLGKNQYE